MPGVRNIYRGVLLVVLALAGAAYAADESLFGAFSLIDTPDALLPATSYSTLRM
jgi:hypothetical protein